MRRRFARRHAAWCLPSIALCLLLGLPFPGNAGPVSGFTGPYAPANWVLTNYGGSDGSVNSAGAPSTIILVGGDAAPDEEGPWGCTHWTLTAPYSGLVSFDWWFHLYDYGADFDWGGWLLEGNHNEVADNYDESGTVSFSVTAGQVFGFYVETDDNCCGPGALEVSNFSGPGPDGAIPEPGTVSLVVAGLVMLLLGRRRKRA